MPPQHLFPWARPLGIAAASPASTVTNWSPANFTPGVVLVITPASGGTTVNSLNSVGFANGQSALLVNASTADPVIFANLGSGLPQNQFVNEDAGSVQILPGASARASRVNGQWRFA